MSTKEKEILIGEAFESSCIMEGLDYDLAYNWECILHMYGLDPIR